MNILKPKGTRHGLLLASCLLLLSQSPLFAQSNYKPGIVITTAGDTLRGFINYREWVLSPVSISFKSSTADKTTQEFDANSSRYFEVTGMEAYQRYEGPITMNPVDLKHLAYNSSPEVANVIVFLKILETGDNVHLLSYNDKIKTRYFIQQQDGTPPQELYYNRYYTSGTGQRQLKTQKGYIGQLLHLASKYEVASPKLKREIETADYKDYNFKKIISSLNRNTGAAMVASEKEVSNIRLFAGIALSSNVATVRGKHVLSNADKNSAQVSPKITVGTDMFFNRHVQKLLIRLEAAAGTARYTIENTERSGNGVTEHTYMLSQQTASLSPQLIYNLYNKDKFKAYLGLAFQLNYSNFSDNVYKSQYSNPDIPYDYEPTVKEDYMILPPFWTSFAIRSGLVINRKYELSAAYMLPAGVSYQSSYSMDLTSYSIGLNYLFSRE